MPHSTIGCKKIYVQQKFIKDYFLYRLSRPLETGNVLYFHLHKNLGQNLII